MSQVREYPPLTILITSSTTEVFSSTINRYKLCKINSSESNDFPQLLSQQNCIRFISWKDKQEPIKIDPSKIYTGPM